MSEHVKNRRPTVAVGSISLLSAPKKYINKKLKASLDDTILPASSTKKKMPVANGDLQHREARRVFAEQSKKAVTSFVGMYVLVAGIVSFSWLLGYFEFTFLWVFISLACLFVVWKAKISKIIAQHLNNEEATLYRKRAFRQDETAEWFNFLLNRWWVFSSSNIEELVKRRMDERLWDIRPSFLDSLELVTFNMGEQTPNFRNVRAFECSESTPGSLQPISWFNVHRPPAGLDKNSSYQVVIETDVTTTSDDFKMIFRGRVGSKRVNVGFDLVVEDLHLQGTLQAIVHLSMDIPFPHVAKSTICFVEKPDVTFNIRVLKSLSIMEVPLLKSWIHNHVMEGFTKAMVDPASVDMVVKKAGPTLMGQASSKKDKAQGVLTVHVKGSPPKEAGADDVRYTVLIIGDRKRQTHEVPATEEWDDVCSFFIYNLATEKIRVKSKCMRLITSTTLEQNEVNLSSFPFQVNTFCETTIDNKDGSKLILKMQYTPLPVINMACLEDIKKAPKSNDVAGVMFVCIHGASNVLVADKTGASDPYCVLFCDRRRILTTPFVPRTRNPHWESWVEFFVADYTRCQMSFFVYDWDGTNTINDDFLGSVHLNVSESEPEIMKKSLTLGYNKPEEGFTPDKQCGHITVSVMFRPVPSVSRSEKFRDVMKYSKTDDYLYKEDLMSPSSVAERQGTSPFLRSLIVSALECDPIQAKNDIGHPILPRHLQQELNRDCTEAGLNGRRSTAAYVDGLLSDKLFVEMTILQGKDLMAMDRNGYSDPFCEVIMSGKKIYTTAVKKKTLFPKWNETVTMEMSISSSPTLTIDLFDKDVISKDFMGKLNLTIEQLKELSIKGTSDWFTLDRAKTGKIQLKCQVISKETVNSMEESQADEVFESDQQDMIKTSSKIVQSPYPPPEMKATKLEQQNSYSPSGTKSTKLQQQKSYPPSEMKAMKLEKYDTMPSIRKRNADSNLRRSNSDLTQKQANHHDNNDLAPNGGSKGGSRTPRARRIHLGKHSESSNSVNVMQRSPTDTASMETKPFSEAANISNDILFNSKGKFVRLRPSKRDSSLVDQDKMYNVSGNVRRVRGKFPPTATDIYCKVRLDLPGNRMSLFHHSRIIGKSSAVSLHESTPNLDVAFEIDRGAGITPDAHLIFDIKHSSKEHLATKSYTLRSLLAEADSMCHWLPIGNDIELEVSLSQGQPSLHPPRRSGSGMLKSFSFRKEKSVY